jgi:tetratricopeptide (TPR) repeat protein
LEVADLYWRQKRPDRALATLDRMAQGHPEDQVPGEVLYRQGLALLSLRRYEDAVDHLMRAVDRGAASADVFYQLGRAELLAGRPASARWAAGQALALAPSHRAARELLAQIDAARQRMAAAMTSPPMP